MKKKSAIIDERQRMELLEVEHIGFWTMFYGLVIILLGQLIFLDWRLIVGEGIALLIGSVVLMVGCLRRGLWDYATTPSQSTYLVSAAIAAFLIFLGSLAIPLLKGVPINFLFLIIVTVGSFAITYAIVAFMGHFVLRRRKTLEKVVDDEDRAP